MPETEKPPVKRTPRLDPALLRRIHDLMVKSRVLEERMIKMNRDNDGTPGQAAAWLLDRPGHFRYPFLGTVINTY